MTLDWKRPGHVCPDGPNDNLEQQLNRLAKAEGVPKYDPRIRWVAKQARWCMERGMTASEAVAGAAVIAFRKYAQPLS
ncbi:hypothetical protein [Anaeromyxobacter sp. Fw109-5]|uniref:hypothetical protein n=1 Tax=Anaeromyxobacter sp. (strain Fw109-5) TaxID=404589 RepID=UPI000158A6A4|nr:hypothetical protein [Anaeromyxobacter sp. Fw109-5]ABS26859.1 hypothetical protein Anae109_2658 [Anaeromyxobacter sp. Fw109-5]